MTCKTVFTRRSFLRNTLAGGAALSVAPMILPSGILAAQGQPGANDRIGVGVIGPGRQGSSLMGQYPRDGAG
ncbi:MAG TPA: twin-arginine translocation signal domain-containing protein, partial [Candidatus Hydrogenedentes bacterium]|nr:twin-arginine translocation signal domain-containing protein [Candidatus Hydrogenedentota bacterium]